MGLFNNMFGGSLTPLGGGWGYDDDYVSPGMKRAWETYDNENNWYGYFATQDDVVRFLDMVAGINVDSADKAEVRRTEVNRDCEFITPENGLRNWKVQHDLPV